LPEEGEGVQGFDVVVLELIIATFIVVIFIIGTTMFIIVTIIVTG